MVARESGWGSRLMVQRSLYLFAEDSNCRHYARCKQPIARVLFDRDMGEGTVLQRVKRARAYWLLKRAMQKDWSSYRLLADADFAKELSVDFWPRWLEILIYRYLKFQKVSFVNQVAVKNGAPDFLVECSDTNSFAVEVTMITAGETGKNSTALPAPGIEDNTTSVVQNVSETKWEIHNGQLVQVANPESQSKLALRFTTAIDRKNGQINKWQSKGVLSSETPVVLAIGTAQAIEETNFRFIGENELLLALYGVGNKLVHFSKSGKVTCNDSLPTNRHESSVSNHGGSNVPVGLFDDPKYRSISAVLLCEDQLFEYGAGKKLLCLNANAATPVQPNLFGNISVAEHDGTSITFHNT